MLLVVLEARALKLIVDKNDVNNSAPVSRIQD